VVNCEKLERNLAGICAECESGFILNEAKTFCGQPIENCQTYTSLLVEKSICAKCNSGYFLNENFYPPICSSGTVSNCKVYKDKLNMCETCDNKFYLNADKECVEHVTIEGCDSYHNTTIDHC
jgi:hypothetical protein